MSKHPETMLVERNGQTVRINKADFDPSRETDPNANPKRSPGRPKRKTEDSEQWQSSTDQ